MWSAKIVSKSITRGIVQIGVEYRSDTDVFTEPIEITGADFDAVKNRIVSKLKTLEKNELLVVALKDVSEEGKVSLAVAVPEEAALQPELVM